MCFVWISEQTTIISLYDINGLVFISEAECLLRDTNWVFKSDKYIFILKGRPLYEGWNFNSGNYLFTTDTK